MFSFQTENQTENKNAARAQGDTVAEALSRTHGVRTSRPKKCLHYVMKVLLQE
jgi:hypothetical protein